MSRHTRYATDERVQGTEIVCDSIAKTPERSPLSDVQRSELDRRLDLFENDRSQTTPWDEIHEKLQHSA